VRFRHEFNAEVRSSTTGAGAEVRRLDTDEVQISIGFYWPTLFAFLKLILVALVYYCSVLGSE